MSNKKQQQVKKVQKQVYQTMDYGNDVDEMKQETFHSVGEIRELNPGQDPNAEVLSLIVTCHDGSSYDGLFNEEKQEVPEGIVTVYTSDPSFLLTIHHRLEEEFKENPDENRKSDNEVLEKIVKEIKDLDPENVLFNLECSSGFQEGFSKELYPFFKFCLDRGFMLMFSDFAMKGLIKTWNESLLGPCPFVTLMTCSGSINLKFEPNSLKESPSTQLELVGNLCESGVCSINTLGGTIVFGVDQSKLSTDLYDVEVMTIVTNINTKVKTNCCTIGGETGTVGHAIVRYKTGGILIASAGHWIELKNLGNVSEAKIEEIAQQYNSGGKSEYMTEYNDLQNYTGEEREMKKQKLVSQMVQKSAPNKLKKKK